MSIILIFLLSILVIFLIYLAFYSKPTVIYKSNKRLDGKTAIITGGTSGIGLEVAKDLARRGARVIVACPFDKEGISGRNEIVRVTGNENVEYKFLDLGVLQSVREFASSIIKNEKRLDILINNAGTTWFDTWSQDGINLVMQINYFGHFLLTLLLLPILKKSGSSNDKARIVNTASLLHLPFMSLKNLNSVNRIFPSIFTYGRSKLCLILFMNKLTKLLEGSNVVIHCADPGVSGTNIFKLQIVIDVMVLLSKTPFEAAQSLIYAAVDDETGNLSGQYIKNCCNSKAYSIAYNSKLAKELFSESMKIVNLSDDEAKQILTAECVINQ